MPHAERERTHQFTEIGDGRIVESWWGGETWCEVTTRAGEVLSATLGYASREEAILHGKALSRGADDHGR